MEQNPPVVYHEEPQGRGGVFRWLSAEHQTQDADFGFRTKHPPSSIRPSQVAPDKEACGCKGRFLEVLR